MDNRIPQYQRAVTPTIESNGPSGLIRGKVLSYNNTNNSTSNNLIRGSPYIRNSQITLSPRQPVTGGYIDINVMGRNASSQSKAAVANKANEQPTATTSGPGNFSKYDLIPIQDEVPLDGIIFSKLRSNHEALVVHRTTEERLRNPERLNLDKRQLEICPILEQEQKLRLLNFQNNYIRVIQNLENLPNLIFLDLYNNKITTLAGSLSMVKGLRVLMTGKNKISAITNLTNLRKLDVLDLHSNDISVVEGLDTLVDLRVLNLAGNKITQIQNGLSALGSLTELNLRRNKLDNVNGLNKLPALQRVFLSHNLISSVEGVQSLFEVPYLIELSLDGNPLSEEDPEAYRKAIIAGIPGLRHLDLKRVTDEERHPSQVQESDLGLSIADAEGSNSLLARSPSEMGGISAASTHNHSAATLPDPDHRPNIADLGNKSTIHSEGNILSRITSRASLQKYIKSSIESMVTDAAHGCRNDIPEKPATSSIDTDKQKEKEKEKEQPTVPETLTSLARSGKITSTSSLFDIEILGPDEKALIAIGNTWEWTPSKRLLASVVEASLCHMKRQTFMHKFNSTHMQMLPALKVMRFLNVDFVTLTQMEVIPPLLKDQIESLSVRGCPISVSMSSQVLRAYFLAAMPKLKVFNDKEITLQDRQECAVMYSSFIRVRLLAEARMSAITPQQRTIHNNGALLRNNRNSALMRDFRNRVFIDRMHYNDGSESEASAANGSAPSLGSSTIEFLNSTKEHPSVVELSASVLRRRILYKHYILNFDKSLEKLFVEALDEVQSNKKILNI